MVLLVQQIYANDDSIKHGYDRHPFSPECKPKNTPSRFMARVRWNVLLADNLVIFGVVTYPKPLRLQEQVHPKLDNRCPLGHYAKRLA